VKKNALCNDAVACGVGEGETEAANASPGQHARAHLRGGTGSSGNPNRQKAIDLGVRATESTGASSKNGMNQRKENATRTGTSVWFGVGVVYG